MTALYQVSLVRGAIPVCVEGSTSSSTLFGGFSGGGNGGGIIGLPVDSPICRTSPTICSSSSEVFGDNDFRSSSERSAPGECSTSSSNDSQSGMHNGVNYTFAMMPSVISYPRLNHFTSITHNPLGSTRLSKQNRYMASEIRLVARCESSISSSHSRLSPGSWNQGWLLQSVGGSEVGLTHSGMSSPGHGEGVSHFTPNEETHVGFLRSTAVQRSRRVKVSVATYGEFSSRKSVKGDQGLGSRTREEPRELLSLTKKKKEFERLQKERDSIYAPPDPSAKPVVPFWRKSRTNEEMEARQLTKRIVSLGRRKQLDQVFSVLAQAKKGGIRVNIITVNAALAACVNCGEVDKALQVFDAMVRPGGVGADSITYGTLLKGLGQAKRLDEAFEFIEAMEDGTAPGTPKLSEVHINTLINACAEAGEALRARGVLSRYRNFGNKGGFSTFTYNLLIKGYARSDNPLEALKVMEEMRLMGMPLERVTYNLLILASVRGGDLEGALDLLEEMKSEARRMNTSAISPDVVTYTTLLKGLAEDGDLEGIRQLVKDMKAMPTCVIDRVAHTAIIDACITAGSAEDGVKFMAEMEAQAATDSQVRPRAHVFLALMRALAERADVARTLELARRMVPDAAGHVWPEDRAEADELVMEAALNAGDLKLARETMATIMKTQKGKPSLTPRGTQAFVRLMAASDFSYTAFQPLFFRKEVSPRSGVNSAMLSVEEMRPLEPSQTVAEVASRFLHVDALPVCDAKQRCLGVVRTRDCQEIQDRIGDIMQPAPPRIPHNALILQAADLLLKENHEFLVVVKGQRGYETSKGGFRQGVVNDYYIEEADEAVLGFIGRQQLFDLDGDSLQLKEEAD